MKTSEAGIALLKQFEGCRLTAYQLAGEKYWTIGYGRYGPEVQPGSTITQAQAEAFLKEDLVKYEKLVEQYVTIPLNQNQFDALVSYTYNRGSGGIKQLSQNCRTVEEYSAGIVKYWGSAERYKAALIERRKKERALFDRKENAVSVIIGSARSDERGKYSGGAPGDQKQSSTPDYSGEVSMQSFYVHSKGWIVLRARSAMHANALATSMKRACNNSCIGYSQSDRYGVVKEGTGTTKKCNADCSSLVRQCVKEATGKDPGDFNTASEASALMATGLFDKIVYSSSTKLCTGDILVTKTKGHTVIVVSGAGRGTETPTGNPFTIPTVLLKKGSKGEGVKWLQYEINEEIEKGCLKGKITEKLVVDGDFGNKTLAALKAFQKAVNIEVDGVAGPVTRSKLKG